MLTINFKRTKLYEFFNEAITFPMIKKKNIKTTFFFLTTLENKIDNKLKEYVNKDELVRDDTIDLFAKVDNENHVLTIEFEGDTLYDGLLVFKVYAGAMVNQMLRRFYIKIVDGEIVDYKGVQDNQITVDGVTIEPAAKSEDYRIEYIPTAELDIESRKKLIEIPIIDPTVKIVGAIIEQSTFKRQMVYTTKDIAYLQDIEALDKKINTLAEQYHQNDGAIYNTYTTVDEVNEVLGNYVLKSDLPEPVDLSGYIDKFGTTDLTSDDKVPSSKLVKSLIDTKIDSDMINDVIDNLIMSDEIIKKDIVDLVNNQIVKNNSTTQNNITSVVLDAINNNPLIVKSTSIDKYGTTDLTSDDRVPSSKLVKSLIESYLKTGEVTSGTCEFTTTNDVTSLSNKSNSLYLSGTSSNPSLIFRNDYGPDSSIIAFRAYGEESNKYDIKLLEDGSLLCYFNDNYKPLFKIINGKVYIDELYNTADQKYLSGTVKNNNSEIEQLKTENTTLKTTIAAFEQRLIALEKAKDPDTEWKEFYVGFTEKANEELASYFAYDYGTESKKLTFWDTNEEGNEAPAGEYLLILHDKDMKKHFIRMIVEENGQYTVYFDEVYLHENSPNSGGGLDNIDLNIDSVENQSFDEIYKKV